MGISRILSFVGKKAVQATPEIKAVAKKIESPILKLKMDTLERTVSPEELRAGLRQGRKGFYSRTIQNENGDLSKVLSDGKKVVIHNQDGVTTRSIYDINDELLMQDTKVLTSTNVGNKTVKTKDINRTSYAKYNEQEFKYTADRVYDSNHQLLGMREVEAYPRDLVVPREPGYYVTKTRSNGTKLFNYTTQKDTNTDAAYGFVKEIRGKGPNKRVVGKRQINNSRYNGYAGVGLGEMKPQHNIGLVPIKNTEGYLTGTGNYLNTSWVRVSYNKKGLPIPCDHSNNLNGPGIDSNMSLKEMREWARKNNPERFGNVQYLEWNTRGLSGLDHLEIPYAKAMEAEATKRLG